MTRHTGIRSTPVAPEDVQRLADASELDNTRRWQYRHDFLLVVADAVRRADSLRRLELSLAQPLAAEPALQPSH
ncbi:MAG: hypothetical protein ABR541_08675 [Candidatus Dormibacteria bacterium]